MGRGWSGLLKQAVCAAPLYLTVLASAESSPTGSNQVGILPLPGLQLPLNNARFSDSLLLSREQVIALGFEATNGDVAAPPQEKENGKEDGPTQRAIETASPTALSATAPVRPQRVPVRPRDIGVFSSTSDSQTWQPIGPFPIPNGQTNGRVDPVSGRVTAIAVDPTDANVAYVGTAQGGLYQTLDGGAHWMQMMDNAVGGPIGTPLAIGSVVVNPSNPDVVFIGTGEGNNNFDGAFGTGFYIVTGAKGAGPMLNGPLNLDAASHDIFAGRAIDTIAVDPTNGNNVFAGTNFGLRGFYSADESPVRPPRGLYRSTNALSSAPTWTRLAVGGGANSIVTSVVVDPGDANHVIVAVQGQTADEGPGIYVSNDALSATPTFTLTQSTPLNTLVKLAINRSGNPAVVTVLAASGESNSDADDGKLYKSIDGGMTWSELPAARGFAGAQGFYNVAVGIDATDANKIYIGGGPPARYWGADATFEYSTDGGVTFTSSTIGLHPDSHAIAVAPSNPAVIYTGNDGGVWKSTDAGRNWVSLNNSTISATQFSDIAVHATDRNLSIAGTQDNGTEMLKSDGSLERIDFGDGGYSLIDQSATSTASATLYHTYYNRRGSIIGTARVLQPDCAREDEWTFHGAYQGPLISSTHCDGTTDTLINTALTDNVNFYAPQALGPGTPNTWYFGTDKLYRSSDRADTAVVASQLLDPSGIDLKGTAISAIAISPQDDNVRVVGLNNGKVFATATGSNLLVQIAGPGATNGAGNTPPVHVSRIAIDPANKAVAYLVYSGYGTNDAPISHVWKTTNLDALNSATGARVVQFAPVSTGLPDVSANAIAVDPLNSSYIYLGTDVGVFRSTDGGSSWTAFSAGLPNVAVFGLALQSPHRVLRAATHGRGMYEVVVDTPPSPAPSPTPTVTPTPTATVAPTITPSPAETPTPSPTPALTATPTASPTPAQTPTPTPQPSATPRSAARALNISTRLTVGVGEAQAIGGFIITGDVPKRVMLRALGPSLARAGVIGALADPVLQLHAADGTLIAQNDNWRDTDEPQITATHVAPNDDAEAAVIAKLSPGNYTFVVSGKNNSSGVALVEAYDLDSTNDSARLANISTRGELAAAGDIMIGGFILGGQESSDVVLRALGPSLSTQGLGHTLADPTLELRDSQGALLASNDDWQDDATQAAQITAAGIPPSDRHEAALALHLPPGAYTAILAGKNSDTGAAIVEIYTLR